MKIFEAKKLIALSAVSMTAACGISQTTREHSSSTNVPSEAISDTAMDLTSGCLYSTPRSFPAGFSNQCMNVNQVIREYKVYQSTKLSASTQAKGVIVVLHGGNGSAEQASNPKTQALGVFVDVAEREELIAIYPNGTLDLTGKSGWNDCRSDDSKKSGADDVMFLSNIIAGVQSKLGIPASRTFMTGTSNGAMMTFRFAIEQTGSIAAIATSSGNIAANPLRICMYGPSQALPILLTHGTVDPVVPTQGGCVASFFGDSCSRGRVLSTNATIAYWLKNHGLSSPVSTNTVEVNANDGGSAVQNVYANSRLSSPRVVTWTLNGAGHPPPSFIREGDVTVGTQNQDIEFAEEAWKFFKRIILSTP